MFPPSDRNRLRVLFFETLPSVPPKSVNVTDTIFYYPDNAFIEQNMLRIFVFVFCEKLPSVTPFKY